MVLTMRPAPSKRVSVKSVPAAERVGLETRKGRPRKSYWFWRMILVEPDRSLLAKLTCPFAIWSEI